MDAQDNMRRCDSCQRHATIPHQPPHEMVNMLYPIPFYEWEVDIVGDLPRTSGSKRQFLVGDLMLRARQASAHGKSRKLESSWDGPYIIRRIAGLVMYELETLEGRYVPTSWNACHMRKYYV
ncbi:hypothetical protein LIER_20402 [Lithospermum erythrorhizon]|uniref:Uncharacterized protein n=1 Tax=Lithospermum erythrorhizon TaxID=34254 RepID=A0AAV3QM96_LITER